MEMIAHTSGFCRFSNYCSNVTDDHRTDRPGPRRFSTARCTSVRVSIDGDSSGGRPQREGVGRTAAARPNEKVALQLSRVATSAYRLLDPRQRDDSNQRAYVGRILPSVLDGAGQTDFHNGSVRPASIRDTPFISDRMSDAQLIELLEFDSSPVSSGIQWTSSLSDEDLLSTTGFSRRLSRIRPLVRRPWMVAIAVAVVAASVAVVFRIRSEPRPDLGDQRDTVALSDSRSPHLAGVDPLGSTAPAGVGTSRSAEQSVVPPESSLAAGDLGGASAEPAESLGSDAGSPTLAPSTLAPTTLAPSALAPTTPDVSLADSTLLDVDPMLPDLDLSGEPGSIVLPVPIDQPKLLTESTGPSPDAIAMTLPNVDPGTDPSSEFLLDDPFAALAESLPSQSDAEIALPSTSAPVSPMLAEPAGTSDLGDPMAANVSDFDPPSAAEIKAARIEITMLIPELAEQILATEAEQRMGQLESLSSTLDLGTADHYTANLMIAEAAWLIESGQSVRDRMQDWIADYRTGLDPSLASSYVRAIDLAATDETRKHLLREGLVLADYLVVHESIEPCQDVVAAGERLAKTLADSESGETLDEFAEAVTQMRRQAASTNRLIGRIGSDQEGGPHSDDPGEHSADAGIAGRYYCLMLRRWERGLPWLAHAADLRVAGVAAKEIELGQLATPDELVDLGERWMACAARETGRTADSMNLHAIDLLEKAKRNLTGLRMLSVDRKIDQVKAQLPFYVLESALPAKTNLSSAVAVEPPARPPVSDLEEPSRLTGRMTIEGRDLGVQLDYGLGVVIRKERLAQIAEQLGENLDSVTLDLSGELELQNPASIKILASAPVTGQRIWIDDDLVTPKSGESMATVVLDSGPHQVRWAFTPQEGEAAVLRIHDITGRPVPVAAADSAGSVPLRTVLMVKVR